jgi:predicted amidohydrolase YtcJ
MRRLVGHQDDVIDRIAPGQRADLVVLDRDILYIPDETWSASGSI